MPDRICKTCEHMNPTALADGGISAGKCYKILKRLRPERPASYLKVSGNFTCGDYEGRRTPYVLPCPFCGCHDNIMVSTSVVTCGSCGAMSGKGINSVIENIESWNTRISGEN